MKRVILTVAITVLVMLTLPWLVFATGAVDMAATSRPGPLETTVASLAVDRCLDVRAPAETNPYVGDSQAIDDGLHHYAEMCVHCHGGPGVKPDEFAKGLNPPAPDLKDAAQDFTDGELFWVTKHGIRMTGMPAFGVTHRDEDIWKIAAFVKQLPDLSEEQQQWLVKLRGDEAEHAEHDQEAGHHGDNAAQRRPAD